MISIPSFLSLVDVDFWKHITKHRTLRDVIDYDDIQRQDFLADVARRINSFRHHIEPPQLHFLPKSSGVLRCTKSFELADISLYYYCVKLLQDAIVEKIKSVPNIFGGFRFSPELRLTPDQLENLPLDTFYEPAFSANNFRVEWGEYQDLAEKLFEGQYDFYVHLDIAHFYDDINHDILEREVRALGSAESSVLDLLFHFLRLSDCRDTGYAGGTIGIPQEDVGEMSRLLANYYLHTFDKQFTKWLSAEYPNAIYTRYADDMWICVSTANESVPYIIQQVALLLSHRKLHLNEGKIHVYNREEFEQHWHFQSWAQVYECKNDVSRSLALLYQLCNNSHEGRWFSPAAYLLRVVIGDTQNVILFETSAAAGRFLDLLLAHPRLVERSSDYMFQFIRTILTRFPELRQKLQAIIGTTKRALYPHVEHWVLQCLNIPGAGLDTHILDCYYSRSTEDMDWYTRCLCLLHFTNNLSSFDTEENVSKLLRHIIATASNLSPRERRYVVVLLSKLPHERGKSALQLKFSSPEDLRLRQFLQNTRSLDQRLSPNQIRSTVF